MPKKHQLRRLRATIFEQQHWAIHPPALQQLLGLLEDLPADEFSAATVCARLGMQAGPGEMQIVNATAYIPVMGILQPKPNAITRYYGGTATSQIETDFQRAVSDSQVRSIVLLVDSPGGSAVGNEEVSKIIYAARGGKPITAYVRGMAASAAYYIASAADRIVASPSSSIGSIGAILFHADQSKMLDDFGITVTPITHGAHKADGNPYQPLTAESRKTLQEYVNAYGDQFVEAVARHRGLTPAEVMASFGQGKVFLADAALRLGMIDSVGALESLPGADLGGQQSSSEHATHVVSAISHAQSNAASAVVSSNAAAVAVERQSEMTKRIKAALYALGLISDAAASDEICQAALNGFFRGSVPDSEEKVLHGLTHRESQPAPTATATATAPVTDNAAAANVQQAHDREIAEARSQAIADDRERRTQIEASGRLLGMSAEDIAAALASDQSHAATIAAWHQKLAESEAPVRSVTHRGEGAERFAMDAVDAMLMRAGYSAASPKPSAEAIQLSAAPLMYYAKQCLAMSGTRVSEFANAEDIASLAMQMSGLGVSSMTGGVGASGPAFNRPGDFPNLLAGVANRILDQAIEIAEPTYPVWTGRIADLPDFKPATIVGMGHFDELDEVMDDEAITALQMNEELSGWIQIGRYANHVGLTPVMAANDDLDSFSQALMSLAVAHENTINRLCLSLITGNVVLPDGVALFNLAGHGNDIVGGGGGAPSTVQANLMRLLHRRQTGIGGFGRVKTPPKIALVPTAWEEAAMQTFLQFSRLQESKLPVTDATINTFRGSIEPVVEPDLEDSSLTVWYTFADPRIRRTVVHAFQRGYGRGGKRDKWFDPARKSMIFDIEGRFAAAVAGHRGAVRNAGA